MTHGASGSAAFGPAASPTVAAASAAGSATLGRSSNARQKRPQLVIEPASPARSPAKPSSSSSSSTGSEEAPIASTSASAGASTFSPPRQRVSSLAERRLAKQQQRRGSEPPVLALDTHTTSASSSPEQAPPATSAPSATIPRRDSRAARALPSPLQLNFANSRTSQQDNSLLSPASATFAPHSPRRRRTTEDVADEERERRDSTSTSEGSPRAFAGSLAACVGVEGEHSTDRTIGRLMFRERTASAARLQIATSSTITTTRAGPDETAQASVSRRKSAPRLGINLAKANELRDKQLNRTDTSAGAGPSELACASPVVAAGPPSAFPRDEDNEDRSRRASAVRAIRREGSATRARLAPSRQPVRRATLGPDHLGNGDEHSVREEEDEDMGEDGDADEDDEDFPYQHGPREILPGVLLGSEENARDGEMLSRHGIRFVLNVAKEVQCPWLDNAGHADPTERSAAPVRPALVRATASTPNLKLAFDSKPQGHEDAQLASKLAATSLESSSMPVRLRFPASSSKRRPALDYLWLRWGHDESDLVESRKFDVAFAFLDEARAQGAKVLVNCQCGVSRSATVVIAYCMREAARLRRRGLAGHQGLEDVKGMHDAYSFVKERSSWIGPNLSLVFQLVSYERALTGEPLSSSSEEHPARHDEASSCGRSPDSDVSPQHTNDGRARRRGDSGVTCESEGGSSSYTTESTESLSTPELSDAGSVVPSFSFAPAHLARLVPSTSIVSDEPEDVLLDKYALGGDTNMCALDMSPSPTVTVRSSTTELGGQRASLYNLE